VTAVGERADTGDLAALALALARWENEGGGPAAVAPTISRAVGDQVDPADPRRVRVGRVYDERGSNIDHRILVDRLWPRGLSRSRADIDEWCREVAPSTALRIWYGHDPDRFAEFERRYRSELEEPGRSAALRHLRELTRVGTVTLLTAARDPEISQAAVLAHALRGEDQAG
jgi:uncharacterized protein YeaO (DUF488 family)